MLTRTCLLLLGAVTIVGSPAAAQTAGDINRLNSSIQICNSPMGAGMAECARLRGQLGGGAGGGNGAAAAGLLGALNAAMSSRAPSVAAPVAPAANSPAIAACVRNAAGDAALIQACLAAPPGVPALGQPIMPSAGQGQDTASAIHRAGQTYHACVAANPGAWQSCVHLLNGGQPR